MTSSESANKPPITSYDFEAYLREIDPSERYEITRLTGGLVNVTVRARRLQPSRGQNDQGIRKDISSTRFQGHASIIIKYAPPFIAAIGESAPFSPYRQIIEAKALNFLARIPAIQAAEQNTRVSIPKVLHEDPARHVLIISDLGDDLRTIDTWLGWSPSDTAPTFEMAESLGMRLGKFLATVHALPLSRSTLDGFVNKEAREVIRREVVEKTMETLTRFEVASEESERLCAMMGEEVEQADLEEVVGVFSVGDCWTGSILVSPDGRGWESWIGSLRVKGGLCRIWHSLVKPSLVQIIVDIDIDVGLFPQGAHIHLQTMADSVLPFSPSSSSTSTFIHALYNSHRKQAYDLYAPWLHDAAVRSAIIRSTCILHGREVIYNAAERTIREGEDQMSLQDMAERGLWYLRASMKGITKEGRNTEGFLKPLYEGDNSKGEEGHR